MNGVTVQQRFMNNPRIAATIPQELYRQILAVQDRDKISSLSGFIAQLIRLGFVVYCQDSNIINRNVEGKS